MCAHPGPWASNCLWVAGSLAQDTLLQVPCALQGPGPCGGAAEVRESRLPLLFLSLSHGAGGGTLSASPGYPPSPWPPVGKSPCVTAVGAPQEAHGPGCLSPCRWCKDPAGVGTVRVAVERSVECESTKNHSSPGKTDHLHFKKGAGRSLENRPSFLCHGRHSLI